MPSQRCSLCAVNYPPSRSECLRCGGPLRECLEDVSPDWVDVDVAAAGTEPMKVEMWRLRILLDAGYALEDAEQLAGAGNVDLHEATELLDRGCTPATAARILL